jgi:hypothetical protein
MRAPSSVIFDVVATRTPCPLPGPPTSTARLGSISPYPGGTAMDLHNNQPGAMA